MPEIPSLVKDAAYVTIGFGVLAFQRAQVQRQELTKAVEASLGDARGTVEDRVKLVEERLEALQKDVDGLLSDVEERLPEAAREWLHAARAAAKDAEGQLRGLLRSA